MATKPRTPAAAENAARKLSEIKKITLPSGLNCEILPFKGKHVRNAQRLMDGDPSKMLFAIISEVCMIEGKKVFMEDIDEMPGNDVMFLMTEFQGVF